MIRQEKMLSTKPVYAYENKQKKKEKKIRKKAQARKAEKKRLASGMAGLEDFWEIRKIKVLKFFENILKLVSFRMDQDKSEKKPPPGLRPCCACKETKKVRDECFLGSGRTF